MLDDGCGKLCFLSQSLALGTDHVTSEMFTAEI